VIAAIGEHDLAKAVGLSANSDLTRESSNLLAAMKRQIDVEHDRIQQAQRQQDSAESATLNWTLSIGAVFVLLLIVVGFASDRWIGRPLQRASDATRAIAAGDHSSRVLPAGPSELAALADDVNVMTDALVTRSAELNAYLSKNLEARTQELERANASLAREVDERARAEVALADTLAAERELEEQLRHQAFHDPLTGLANRARFMDRLDHALARIRSSESVAFVMFMDLDNFKNINDSMGHAAGDRTICEVGRRISSCLRSGDTAARLGGDEFAILLEDTHDIGAATRTARRLIEIVRAPIESDGPEIVISASIGIALGDANSVADDVVRNADIAMYVAKNRGKGRYEVYEAGMHARLADHLSLLTDLRHAVRRNEMVVHYQPTVSLATGAAFGAEALIRWNHPTRGMLPPLEFIALAEESGDILQIGRYVLTQACLQARLWQDRYPDRHLEINVNVSAKQIQDPGFVETVRSCLADTGLEPARLVLEITEIAMLQDPERTLEVLSEVRQLGARIALDDFGTGYSSLSYLRRFPIDVLKIDKSFVDDIDSHDRQELLAKAVIELGQSLQLQVIAEGIERNDQLNRLRALDCQLGQGFLFSRALDAASIDAFFDAALGSREEEAA
jgi:diguanylate cyclase (GGDEF)-like protein